MLCPEIGSTELKLSLIAAHARRDKQFQFTSLAHLLNEKFLRNCFMSLNRNKALGQDQVSWADYDKNRDENIASLVARLKDKSYRPIPARRVYIPKGSGGTRPLGISAIENKIVERGVAQILSSIYEQDFSDHSYGFRPGRNCHQALKELSDLTTFGTVNHIVEADIKGFFDNVSHEHLMEFLKIRIKDSSLLALIEKFLKAGYVDAGLMVKTEQGTPQGSIISPVLANIFLHYVLDDWFETLVKPHLDGYCEIIRYADDFVIVVRYQTDAERIERVLKKRFNKFGLEIHPEKSRRFSFGKYERENAKRAGRKANTFDFLGFTHFCGLTRAGKFKVGRLTSKKKFNAKCKDLNSWLKNVRNAMPVEVWWGKLAAKLRGHYQYYGVSENSKGISNYYFIATGLAFKWLNRRSQRNSMNWEQFHNYLKLYPLPLPLIVHSFYSRSM